jgi:hypothetical protein
MALTSLLRCLHLPHHAIVINYAMNGVRECPWALAVSHFRAALRNGVDDAWVHVSDAVQFCSCSCYAAASWSMQVRRLHMAAHRACKLLRAYVFLSLALPGSAHRGCAHWRW